MGFFGNLVNNYYYGKAGKGDYRIADMPTNRLQLFGAVFRVRWAALAGVNLLHMIAWLPGFIWTIINISVLMSSTVNFAAEDVQSLVTTYLMGMVPCIAITGPTTAGTTFVLRNWARDQHSFPWLDFRDAVKANWKQALGVSVISGFMPLIIYVAWSFYGRMASASSMLFILPLSVVLIAFILWKLSEMLIYTMIVTYDLRLRDQIKNALILTITNLPKAIGIKLLTLVIPALIFGAAVLFPSAQMIILLIFGLLTLFYLPAFHRLIIASYANAVCEKNLNPRIGAPTNIGLRPDDWDDTEYIPQDDEE